MVLIVTLVIILGVIPSSILQRAKGLAIMTVVKAGMIWAGRLGTF